MMKRWSAVATAAVLCGSLFLAACGGGGSSGATTPPPPAGVTAPSGLSYTSPQVYTVGQAITPITSDRHDAATSTLENTINDFSGRLRLSSDRAVLAAGGAFLDLPIGGGLTDVQKTRIYNLPGDGLVSTWPSNNTDLPATGISLSAGGGFLGQLFAAGTATVTPVASGSSPTWTNTGSCPVALLNQPYLPQGATIYNAAGTSPLPELHEVQVVTSDSIYAPKLNAIFSVSSGAATWSSTTQSYGIGAVAGTNVVFASGRSVVVLPQ